MQDANSELVVNSLLPGLAVLTEMDHLGGFPLAAVSYLLLISQSARSSQLLWQGCLPTRTRTKKNRMEHLPACTGEVAEQELQVI